MSPTPSESLIIEFIDSMRSQGYAVDIDLPGSAGGLGCQIAARTYRSLEDPAALGPATQRRRVVAAIEALA